MHNSLWPRLTRRHLLIHALQQEVQQPYMQELPKPCFFYDES